MITQKTASVTGVALAAFKRRHINPHIHRMLESLGLESGFCQLLRLPLRQNGVAGIAIVGDDFSVLALVQTVNT